MKSLNKKASIFVYLLILINISLIIWYIVLNNTFVVDSSLIFSQRNQILNHEIAKKWKINIELSKFYNSNWWWFEDFFSCPNNLSFSWVTMTWSNINSSFRNNFWDFHCDFSYSWLDWSLYYDKNIADFSNVTYDWVTTNLLNDFFINEQKITWVSIDNSETTQELDSSSSATNTLDSNNSTSYISQKTQKPSIWFDFSIPVNLSKIIINKDITTNQDFWNNAKIVYEFTDWSTITSTISWVSTRDNIEINFWHANFRSTWQVSWISINWLWTQESININEIEFYEWATPGWDLWYSDWNLNDSDNSVLEFDSSWLWGWNFLDMNFNSDNYIPTSSWNVNYPDNFFDDDNFARLNIQWNINSNYEWYYNIFWNNSKTNDFIDSNTNNDFASSFFVKSWDVTSWKIYLDVFSWEDNLDYDLKIVEFDKSYFNSSSWLITNNIYQTSNLNSENWFINLSWNNLSLNNVSTWNEFSFDFANKDYAIFIKNNSEKTLVYKINWEENLSSKDIYLNPINDSKKYFIETYVNHIIESTENNYFWDEEVIIWKK